MLSRPAALLLLGLLALSALPVVEGHHYKFLQPGAHMTSPAGCTMAFVVEDAQGRLYMATAAHCVARVGQRVSVDYVPMGTVAWRGAVSAVDVALVAVDADRYGDVDPAVRHWGGPTGVAQPGALIVSDAGKPVVHYGYGIVYQDREVTRSRVGVLQVHDDRIYGSQSPVIFGDSGGPVMLASGEALGIVSHLGIETGSWLAGHTMRWGLERANADTGLGFRLVTAPLADPVQRTLDQVEHGLLDPPPS